jgi:dTMP kinase
MLTLLKTLLSRAIRGNGVPRKVVIWLTIGINRAGRKTILRGRFSVSHLAQTFGQLPLKQAASNASLDSGASGRDHVAMFFSIDGIDGTGKTTQLDLFVGWLRSRGLTVTTCRDPGSTRLGEELRQILLHKSETAIGRRSEMLLYMAARAQLVDEVIRPALAAGQVVVCDRYLLANVVYQGYGGGLAVEDLWRVGEVAIDGVVPTLVFVLDMSADDAARRLNREPDRMESQGLAYMERVRQGYLAEAACRANVIVLDAARDIEAVQADMRAAAERALNLGVAGSEIHFSRA